MNMIPSELKEIEKKDWHLLLLLICLFLVLTSFIVLVVFYSDVSKFFQEKLDIYSFNFLFIGYLGLSLLFIAYIIFQEISVRHLRHDLIAGKINLSVTLGKRYQELKALFEVSTLVNSEVEPQKIFHMISRQALSCLNGDRASLMILDSQLNRLRCVAAYGHKQDLLKDAEVEVGKGICGWVIEHDQPLLLDKDKLSQYQFIDLVEKEGTIFSALCVPLKVKGSTKGVLNVNSFREDKKFNDEDLKLLTIFAENAAISIEKAELYQEHEKQAKSLKKTVQELMSAQSQLIDSQKMRALGDLASGMAHDFNNVLAIAAGRAELALNLAQDEKLIKSLRQILKAVSEGQNTVRRIQEFYRTRSEGGWVEVDVAKLIQEVVDVTKPKWEDEAQAKGVKIEVKTEVGEVRPVMGNPSEILEALTNLMLNAIEAMPQGGKITLRTKTVGDSVVVSVVDTGVGMTEEVKSRLFDPFFTTKTTRNAGLGLSVVYGVITRHKGTIDVQSSEAAGTNITIRLPVSKEPQKEKIAEIKSISSLSPTKVLVIDDNEEVRDIISEMLTTKGHKVIEAEDGVRGLELFDEKDKFDLIFVNLSLPKLSGWEVIQRLKEKDPDSKVALLTGWGAQINFEEAKDKGADFLIPKPFKAEDLLTVLGQATREKESVQKI
jgi:signal transduction histidine kinase/ActR/RegA family two-component response regulator